MPAPKSLKIRLQAAMAYLACGFDSVKAASLLGNTVASRTIREWTETDWWPDAIAQAKPLLQLNLDAALTEIIHLAVDKSKTRLIEGDPYVKKDQTLGYKPVTAKDATMVAAIYSDKRALIRGEPTRRTETIKEGDRLQGVLDNLKKPVEEKPPKGTENLH